MCVLVVISPNKTLQEDVYRSPIGAEGELLTTIKLFFLF